VTPDGNISTVAGNGTAGFADGPATAASLNAPEGVAVDSAGDLYIADLGNYRVRKVSAGIITTVAGNGTGGFVSDGGLATLTTLYFPTGVAVDNAGNIFIADQYNLRVRKVSATTGLISTLAGNGRWDYSGDNGAATAASLSFPTGVAVDDTGNVYIADKGNNAVRKVFDIFVPVAPGVPTGVSATAGNAQATVSFTAPLFSGGSAITGYTVTSNPTGGVDSNAGTTGLSHLVTGLANGTAYTFTVTATNGIVGSPSAASGAVTPGTVPGAPVIGAATAGNGQATVTFTAPGSDGGSAITGYTVTSNPAGGVDSNAGTTGLSHLVTGLTNGTSYTFTVTATNAAGTSAPSTASSGVVPVAPVAPEAPHDGIINPASGKTVPDISDALLVLNQIVGRSTLTTPQLVHADVAPLGTNGKPLGDGRVDIADVIMILRRSIGVGSW
jgi:hypothetical protein